MCEEARKEQHVGKFVKWLVLVVVFGARVQGYAKNSCGPPVGICVSRGIDGLGQNKWQRCWQWRVLYKSVFVKAEADVRIGSSLSISAGFEVEQCYYTVLLER